MKRIIYIIIGSLFLLMGFVGLLLPVIPQVPFWITGMAFLMRGSKRLEERITRTAFYRIIHKFISTFPLTPSTYPLEVYCHI